MVVMGSNSLCMFLSNSNRFYKTIPGQLQKRAFGSIPTVSEKDYNLLLAAIATKKSKLRLLRQDSSSNPKEIDSLQRDLDKKQRILATCTIVQVSPIIDETAQ